MSGVVQTKRLLSCRDAAELTGLTESYWRRRIQLREIDFVKIGKSVRIPLEQIERRIAVGLVIARG